MDPAIQTGAMIMDRLCGGGEHIPDPEPLSSTLSSRVIPDDE